MYVGGFTSSKLKDPLPEGPVGARARAHLSLIGPTTYAKTRPENCARSCTHGCVSAGSIWPRAWKEGRTLVTAGSEMLRRAVWLHAALSYIPPTQHIIIAAAKGSGQGYRAEENLEEPDS